MVYRINIIKVKYGNEIPENYTGIVEFEHGYKCWRKNGLYHREDGPARILVEGYKQWWLDGVIILDSRWNNIDLKNYIILSKEPHPLYPTTQVWKYIDEYGIQEQIIIPGMEGFVIE